ncbi:MAG TPA: ribonuclease Z [Patescibacteria group bacterium]|nr:ribonuclease Z [Patescibacteria group bacterium]
MKIHFLGTNSWYTTPTGNTASILVDSDERYIIFDAGNGLYKIDQYIKENKPIALFISHFHIDHVSGLQILSKFNFPQGVDIYIAKGRTKDFETFAGPPYTIGYKDRDGIPFKFKTQYRLHELELGESNIGFPVEVFEMYHLFGDHAYKLEIEGKVIAYSGDTGEGSNSMLLAKNADVLIHECTNDNSFSNEAGHVNPKQAAKIAKEGNAKKLILTHFAPGIFTTIEKRKQAEYAAKEIFMDTIAATDDLVIEV